MDGQAESSRRDAVALPLGIAFLFVFVASIPYIAWEALIGPWLIVKGARRNR